MKNNTTYGIISSYEEESEIIANINKYLKKHDRTLGKLRDQGGYSDKGPDFIYDYTYFNLNKGVGTFLSIFPNQDSRGKYFSKKHLSCFWLLTVRIDTSHPMYKKIRLSIKLSNMKNSKYIILVLLLALMTYLIIGHMNSKKGIDTNIISEQKFDDYSILLKEITCKECTDWSDKMEVILSDHKDTQLFVFENYQQKPEILIIGSKNNLTIKYSGGANQLAYGKFINDDVQIELKVNDQNFDYIEYLGRDFIEKYMNQDEEFLIHEELKKFISLKFNNNQELIELKQYSINLPG